MRRDAQLWFGVICVRSHADERAQQAKLHEKVDVWERRRLTAACKTFRKETPFITLILCRLLWLNFFLPLCRRPI